MILLSTNAENIFWLGRYLTRTQYLCAQFPFTQDQPAMDYAHAFCLPAFDACSLN
ncbi:alpha-E domain-containing protein, partial [bacterium LRH843]|nr:alpha-E domain-containing protein [bacterium LRH843]